MFHPCRGGVRGGKDQFTWDSVKTDKDRECYLGHSLMAPVGRWQNGKDLTWYAKDDEKATTGGKSKVASEEFLKAKELEEKALMAALGYKVVEKKPGERARSSDDEEETVSKKKSSKKKPHKYDSSSDDEDDDSSQRKKHKVGPSAGPALDDSKLSDTEELDRMLLKLINKYSIREIHEALGDSDYGKRSDESDDKEKKHKSHKKKKKKRKHHKSSKDKRDD